MNIHVGPVRPVPTPVKLASAITEVVSTVVEPEYPVTLEVKRDEPGESVSQQNKHLRTWVFPEPGLSRIPYYGSEDTPDRLDLYQRQYAYAVRTSLRRSRHPQLNGQSVLDVDAMEVCAWVERAINLNASLHTTDHPESSWWTAPRAWVGDMGVVSEKNVTVAYLQVLVRVAYVPGDP
ncbi:MAG: hypothetical protein AAF663_00040 [Planctomycetota bacterium]